MAMVPKLRAAFLFPSVKLPDASEESLPNPSSKSNPMKTARHTTKMLGLSNTRASSLQGVSTPTIQQLLKHTHKQYSNLTIRHVLHECRVQHQPCFRLCEERCLVSHNLQFNLLHFLPFLPNSFDPNSFDPNSFECEPCETFKKMKTNEKNK